MTETIRADDIVRAKGLRSPAMLVVKLYDHPAATESALLKCLCRTRELIKGILRQPSTFYLS
ncbi:hypothetical protein G6M50_38000 [Agrobacterium rhizogenes]|nr:hypothetical protein [Rhizobium rhizogenes]NTJ83584.1 hypothetical protein [Rhizobium rhizogenes]